MLKWLVLKMENLKILKLTLILFLKMSTPEYLQVYKEGNGQFYRLASKGNKKHSKIKMGDVIFWGAINNRIVNKIEEYDREDVKWNLTNATLSCGVLTNNNQYNAIYKEVNNNGSVLPELL